MYATLALLAGCGPKEATDSDPVDPCECNVIIDETFPSAGAGDAFFASPIEFHLSDPDPTAALTVSGVDGASALDEDEDRVIFTPDAPLSPLTAYSATLDYCGGCQQATVDFTTSEVGEVVGPMMLDNRAYRLGLESGRVLVPEGVGDILLTYLGEASVLVGVRSADEAWVRMIGAVASSEEPEVQDFCLPTLDFPDAGFGDNPLFQIGPETTELAVAGLTIRVEDLHVSGAFSPDADYLAGARLAGRVDTRGLGELIDEASGDGAVCDLVSGCGVTCVPCGDGAPYCLELDIADMTAEIVPGMLYEVEQEDCHEQCEASTDNPECAL